MSNSKVTPQHLTLDAYLYVRQSTLHQVIHHTESTRRQYDLRERAVTLGWSAEQIIVIDNDQGQSGATADRVGFQRLVTEVGMGHAGLVMGLEVSRLARNSMDWHRLLEICALSNTLILDEDGLYNPSDFNDRLLLGLKGTMSEAELHMLRARLNGGLRSKARRGELKFSIPIGFVYDDQGQVALDPDKQVQESIQQLFTTFRRVGTALGTTKAFIKEKLLFPRREPARESRSNNPIAWKDLDVSTVLRTLRNPRYAGIYCYGRARSCRRPDGRYICKKQVAEDWLAWIPDAHEGYITQQEYEENLRRIEENARAYGADRRSPPREGPALLQGIVLCRKCGRKMRTRYHSRANGELVPSYLCPRKEGPTCQAFHGILIDKKIGELLVGMMTPMALEVSLRVQQELEQQCEQTEKLRNRQVERSRYEAELARQRFLQVDPNNRLVAATLEAEWNEKLKLLTAAIEDCERQRTEDRKSLGTEQTSKIMSLASDFPKLWDDPGTPARERKRIVRLIIEDVALQRTGQEATVRVSFKAGTTKSFTLTLPRSAAEMYRTDSEIIHEVDRLLDHHTEYEIAELFNKRGLVTSRGKSFTPANIISLRTIYKLRCRFHRLRDRGYLRTKELAGKLLVDRMVISRWYHHGLLQAHRYGAKRYLFEDPTIATNATLEEVRDQLRTAFVQCSKSTKQERGAV